MADEQEIIAPAVERGFPAPYFGGKRHAARIVWDALGRDIKHYVEPFCGTAAVLLAEPAIASRTETINDIDAYVSNALRALKYDPIAVAQWADWPVSEVDLHARHLWLLYDGRPDPRRLMADPDYYDAKAAGWWIWGLSCWIGSEWCSGQGKWTKEMLLGLPGPKPKPRQKRLFERNGDAADDPRVYLKLPALGDNGKGVQRTPDLPSTMSYDPPGVFLKRPHLTAAQGIHQLPSVMSYDPPGVFLKRPHLADAGRGVHRPEEDDAPPGVHKQLPNLENRGKGVHTQQHVRRIDMLLEWFQQIALRLDRVRITCGDWKRVCTEAVLFGPSRSQSAITGVFLDPPYVRHNGRDPELYAMEGDVAKEAYEWAFEHGNHPRLRIVIAGWDGDVELPPGWRSVGWNKPGGSGYANMTGKNSQSKERLWLSPNCLPVAGETVAQAGLLLED